MSLIQVMASGDKWDVLEDGKQVQAFSTQQEAEDAGRARARDAGAEFQIHGEDGKIREKDSYGSDPREISG
jgi:uncharacterized protein DUF2188